MILGGGSGGVPTNSVSSSSNSSVLVPCLPLTEDLHLRMFPPLDSAHKEIDFDLASRPDMSAQHEVGGRRDFITSLRIVRYTHIERIHSENLLLYFYFYDFVYNYLNK